LLEGRRKMERRLGRCMMVALVVALVLKLVIRGYVVWRVLRSLVCWFCFLVLRIVRPVAESERDMWRFYNQVDGYQVGADIDGLLN
jgi:hypothetical protein